MPYKNPADEKACRLRNRHKKLAYMRKYAAKNKERENARCKKWYYENKDYAREQQKVYARTHPEVRRSARDKYRSTTKYRKLAREYTAKWRNENHESYLANNRAWVKQRYGSNINFRILCRLRARLQKKLLNRGIRKVKNTLALTGCTPQFLRGYLEGQFKPGWNWDNIHIDHHIPCAAFDLTDPKQQEQCFHYSNLKPLLAVENLQKGKKLPMMEAR